MADLYSAESGDTPTLVPIENAEAMRDYLDALNDAGIDCRAVGMDSRGEPFLISLSGCYADSEVVLYGNPWDNEVDWGTGPSCVECMAQRPHGIDSVRFPAFIVQAPTEDGAFAGCGVANPPAPELSADHARCRRCGAVVHLLLIAHHDRDCPVATPTAPTKGGDGDE
ncbi:hypothetical protein [Nocardioides soli]|uniref:Uncharacterized protein n=1 Tax=Nocardioides soli TaxID=1036020 RepID=A0A7W4VTA7_9ACTN|nr:hypothetical protein [Nocardioides soli]MBB3040992.1 hypothetical protein [Nocardioides soli]